MVEEELLKDDPLKKTKKITLGSLVIGISVAMVMAFASMHWICSEYFNFKANENDSLKSLEDLRAKYLEEESAAKKRLSECEARAKIAEEQAKARAADAESKSKHNIEEAETKAKSRINSLEQEYEDKRAEKEGRYKKILKEYDDELASQKGQLAEQIKGYKDSFAQITNSLEAVIADLQKKEAELRQRIAQLPDVRNQYVAETNDLANARAERDSVLKEMREAQEELGNWLSSIGNKKGECSELSAKIIELQEGEKTAKERIDSLSKEYEQNKAENERKYAEQAKTFDDTFAQKKAACDAVIADLQKQEVELRQRIAKLPDVRNQYTVEEKSLAAARSERDVIREEVRKKQDELGDWKTKVGDQKGVCAELESKIVALRKDLTEVEVLLASVRSEKEKVDAEKRNVEAEVQKNKDTLAGVMLEVKTAEGRKQSLLNDIDDLACKRAKFETDKNASEAALSAVESAKSKVEEAYEVAKSNLATAESAFEEKKLEINERIKGLEAEVKKYEQQLEEKKKAVGDAVVEDCNKEVVQ